MTATLFDPAPYTMTATRCHTCAGEHPAAECPHGVALELDLYGAHRRLVILVPCSAAKALPDPHSVANAAGRRPTPAELAATLPAGELYTGGFHQYARRHAARLGADVVIASANAGLVDLDHQLHSYDMSIRDAERNRTGLAQLYTRTLHQARRLGLLEANTTVVSFLPKRYAHHIAAAGVPFVDALAGSRGIGEQRGRIARLTRDDLLEAAQ